MRNFFEKIYDSKVGLIPLSSINVVDIKSGESIFTRSSNNKNTELNGMSRSGRTVVDIETGEVIYTNKCSY